MNIYFIDPRYIRPEDTPYLLEVLSIKRVYSYIPKALLPEVMSSSIPKHIKTTYCNNPEKQESFYKNTTISICNNIVPLKKENGRLTRPDLDYGIESKTDTPYNNLFFKDDFNAIVFATCKTGMGHNGKIYIPRFNFDNSCFLHEQKKEIATETSKFCLNLLRKQLGTDKYEKRICFIKFDEFLTRSFYFKDGKWNEFNLKGKDRSYRFISQIAQMLRWEFPEAFPVKEENGINYLVKTYPTKEALDEYNLIKEISNGKRADYYNMNNPSQERYERDTNSYYLDAYGDSMSDAEYDNYMNNSSDDW